MTTPTPESDTAPEAPEPQEKEPDLHRPEVRALLTRYWRDNVRIMLILLAVWAFAGLGCGVLLADWLNQFKLPGTAYPLGFWFAQQGSIIVFVLLILIYCVYMNCRDARHHRELAEINGRGEGQS